jgi:hypothetical protein
MEYVDKKIININGIMNIRGTWTQKRDSEYIYNGDVIYSEPLFSINFIEYVGNKIEWTKSERGFSLSPKIYLNMYHYKNFIKENGLPDIYNGEMELGKIFLLTKYGKKIERYEIYITKNVIKIGRNGIWKIRTEYINETNEKIISKIQYGRSGKIK